MQLLKNSEERGGLKINMTKMACAPILRLTQRTWQPDETEEEVVQDSNQSDYSVHEPDNDRDTPSEVLEEEHGQQAPVTDQPRQGPDHSGRKGKIKWPPSNSKAEWKKFDEDVDAILAASSAGGVDRKIEGMSAIIYNVGLDRLGLEEQKQQGRSINKSRRQQEMAKLRKYLRQLARQYRLASGTLTAGKEEVEDHLRDMHSDPIRNENLPDYEKLIRPEEPEQPFDESEPKLKEVREVIRKARAGSSPGPNGVPYKVYKNCSRLTVRLWMYLRIVWRRGRLTDSWHQAKGCFIPKEENSELLNQFRTISLLNIEGEIFIAIVAKRMTTYMLTNRHIEISVQKGGVPCVSGCVEHTSVLSQIIREAKEQKGGLAVIWLDLANAYGSMPYKVVQLTLERYHVPEKNRHLLEDYIDRLQLKFTLRDLTTSWQRLEVGIVTGCTVLVILFSAAMNLMVKSLGKMSRWPWMKGGVRQPPLRAFMDDMTISTKTVVEAKWTLEEIKDIISCARMRIKPVKSRSLVLRKGKVCREVFKIGEDIIPTVSEKPVKCLGKYFDDTLNSWRRGECQ
ncbi:uncharacterized protein LOC132565620 [Ylistrum balloti]|uniref:uncharacterized protein LOC132565620 n=1 Tax=Ylistrum balloti TaxID=509963 RepID=UPI002905BC62|nr:uncharacterized protein LOC132565620 [Ylistrum balloti]